MNIANSSNVGVKNGLPYRSEPQLERNHSDEYSSAEGAHTFAITSDDALMISVMYLYALSRSAMISTIFFFSVPTALTKPIINSESEYLPSRNSFAFIKISKAPVGFFSLKMPLKLELYYYDKISRRYFPGSCAPRQCRYFFLYLCSTYSLNFSISSIASGDNSSSSPYFF